MTISHQKCMVMAQRIVKAYNERKLRLDTIDKDVIYTLITRKGRRLQVRQNVVNSDRISEMVGKIRVLKHVEMADPILVLEDDEGWFLVNGNHTATLFNEIIRLRIIPGLNTAPIAIIPEDMLPSDPQDRLEVLKLVAVQMNKVEKIVQGMTKDDIKHLIQMDMIDGKNIDDDDYQEVMAESAMLKLSVIRQLVSKVKEESLNLQLNTKFNHKQYSVSDLTIIKHDRYRELGTEYEITWAVTGDKTWETLGKAIGKLIESPAGLATKAHIMFHFKNYADVRELKDDTEKKIKMFQDLSLVPISYEFLSSTVEA